MFFASKYVYDYSDSEEELLENDDFERRRPIDVAGYRPTNIIE